MPEVNVFIFSIWLCTLIKKAYIYMRPNMQRTSYILSKFFVNTYMIINDFKLQKDRVSHKAAPLVFSQTVTAHELTMVAPCVGTILKEVGS